MVDEAYGEFYDQTAIDLLPKHPNLIILKTLSKAFGAAGIRIGYLIAHPDLRDEIIKGKIPFDINIFSHTAAMAILNHKDLIQKRIDFICSERRARLPMPHPNRRRHTLPITRQPHPL